MMESTVEESQVGVACSGLWFTSLSTTEPWPTREAELC
jgi:hypothetical protein